MGARAHVTKQVRMASHGLGRRRPHRFDQALRRDLNQGAPTNAIRLTAATLLLAASPLAAQLSTPTPRSNTREGFWIGAGLGAGDAGVDCQNCSSARTTGWSGYLRLGGTLSPSILLGGEVNGWMYSDVGDAESLKFASGVLLWYPSRTGAFFLKVGLGAVRYAATAGGNTIEATAPSGSLGLGVDIRIARNVSVTPYVNGLRTGSGSFTYNGRALSGQDIKLNLVQIGVGLTRH